MKKQINWRISLTDDYLSASHLSVVRVQMLHNGQYFISIFDKINKLNASGIKNKRVSKGFGSLKILEIFMSVVAGVLNSILMRV